MWTEERVTPFYKDYVVKIQKKGVEDNNHVLSIDLHPDTGATFDDAILNGVEVFKLSNPDGNLAGPSQMLLSLPFYKNFYLDWCGDLSGTHFSVLHGSLETKEVRALCLLLSTIKVLLLAWSIQRKVNKEEGFIITRRTMPPVLIDQIKIATDNFHQELIIGRGGFGYV